MIRSRLPIAVATHAARDMIGEPPGSAGGSWPGLHRFLDWAAETGFDGIDVSTSVFDVERSARWWRGLHAQVAARGLEIASINCLRSSLADAKFWQLGDRRIRRAIEIAEDLGIPSVNVSLAVPPERLDANAHRQRAAPPGSSRIATAKERSLTIERLSAIHKETTGRSTRLVLELHHCSVIDTASALRSMIDDLDDSFTANPDVVNELWAFETIEATAAEIVDTLAPVSRHLWHVKDYTLGPASTPGVPRNFVDVAVGSGATDYADAIARMLGAGFDGWISVERSGVGDFLRTAREGLAFLHSHLPPINARSTT